MSLEDLGEELGASVLGDLAGVLGVSEADGGQGAATVEADGL